MAKATTVVNALTSGEWSPRAAGRFDLSKYASGAKKVENFLTNQVGGSLFRPGTRYLASTKDNGVARIFPFQYSADQDYVVEAGDLYFRLYSNSAALVSITTNPTKLLCSFDSNVDAQKDIVEIGNTGHVITKVGTAALSNLQKKFGTTSLLLDGNSDYLTMVDHANWDLIGSAADSWTIDFWVKHTNATATVEEPYVVQEEGGGDFWQFYRNTNESLVFESRSGAGLIIDCSSAISVLTDTDWHHVALCKVADEYGIYLDGVQVAYVQDSSTDTFAAVLSIGNKGTSATFFDGNMDDIRITKSNAFTAAPNVGKTDTITIPTAAHTSDANTYLLISCDPLDASITGHWVKLLGTANLDTGVDKFGTGSLLLDGNSDYAEIADHADWDIFANVVDNWTIDLWVKHTDHAGNEYYVTQYEDAQNYWEFSRTDADGIRFKLVTGNTATIALNGTDITDTNWHHIALCKVGDKYGIYVDGTQVAYVQDASIDTFAGVLRIGTLAASSFFDGSIDDVRIIKSNAFSAAPVAAKTDTIVIPTSAHSGAGTTQTEVVTPYVEADLFELQMAQYNDVMYIVHPDYAPYKLSRTGASAFTLALVAFVRPPLMDTNITATTITPSADAGAGRTLTASVATFNVLHIGGFFRVKSGIVKITAYTSPTVVTGDVQAEPDGTAGNLATGPAAVTDWAEGAFSDYRGWPSAIGFHEQRLYYANTKTEPQKGWASYIGAYDSFDITATTDDYSITFEVATEQRVAIKWLSSGNRSLTMGTIGGTFSVSSSNTLEAIAPDNIVINRDTNYGVAPLMPKRISSFLYYIQRDFAKLRELSYSFQVDSTVSNDMTLLADHILRDGGEIVDIDHQQSPNDRIYCVRDDGEMAVLTRNPEQEVMGWCRFTAGKDAQGVGEFESVCVIPKSEADDQVWVVVKRNINGTDKRFIEYFMGETFDEDWDAVRCDSSVTLDSPVAITGMTNASPGVFTGTSHGLTTGDQVKINGVVLAKVAGVDSVDINGTYLLVEGADANKFTLTTLLGVAINPTTATGYGAYVSSGEVRKMVTAISGLGHLTGETVVAQTDGYVPTTATYTVVAGAITLPAKAAIVHVGLPYEGTIQLMKLSDGSPTGTGQTRTRRIFHGALRLDRSHGLSIGRAEGALDDLQYSEDELYTGDVEKVFQTTWDKADEIIIRQDKALPANILAIILRSQTEEG